MGEETTLKDQRFFLEESRMHELMAKLLKLGQEEKLSPHELAMVLGIAAGWMHEELGLKVHSVERLDIPADN